MKKKSQIDYAVAGVQIVAEECQSSFFYFVQQFWSVIIKEEAIYNWHIEALCNELQELSRSIVARSPKPYDLIINIPPGTTKSTITTIMFPAWLWTQDPTIRVITNSYSMDLSIEHAVKSRDIITSDKYKKLFPKIILRRDKGAKSSYENTLTGARYATSTGGTITGKHAHVILNDDPLNPQQSASEVDRNTANEHTKTLSSRKVDKRNTPTITIMQRLHELDVTGYLLSKKSDKIKHICLPAELGANVMPAHYRDRYKGGMLDPVRLSRDVLAEQLVDLGSRQYAGQYSQNPVVDGGNIIKRNWFRYITQEEFNTIRKKNPIVFFVDTAFKKDERKDTSKEAKNDPSGIIGTCRIGDDMYVTVARKVFKEFPELVRFIPTFVNAHGYTDSGSVRIEPKANGISVVHQLRESTRLNVKEIDSPLVKDSKIVRLTAASPRVECQRVILVEGDWNEAFVDELCGFPAKAHDEYVDCLSYAADYHLKDKKKMDTGGLIDYLHF